MPQGNKFLLTKLLRAREKKRQKGKASSSGSNNEINGKNFFERLD